MNIKSDIEIAQEHTPKKITEIAAAAGSMRSTWSCTAIIRRRWIFRP